MWFKKKNKNSPIEQLLISFKSFLECYELELTPAGTRFRYPVRPKEIRIAVKLIDRALSADYVHYGSGAANEIKTLLRNEEKRDRDAQIVFKILQKFFGPGRSGGTGHESV